MTDACMNATDMSSQSQSSVREEQQRKRVTRTNVVAIVAGALASTSAAVVASFLGVAGTLIGAALVSVVSSLAGAVYSGLLASTQDLVRRSALGPARQGGREAEPREREAAEPSQAGEPAELLELRELRRRPARPRSPERRWLRRPATRWLAVGAAALLMFAVAIGIVTGVEAAIHEPLATAVAGRDEGDAKTSVGAALSGSSDQQPAGQQHQPSSTTEGEGSASSSPSSTSAPGGQNGSTPSSTTPPGTSTTTLPPSTQ